MLSTKQCEMSIMLSHFGDYRKTAVSLITLILSHIGIRENMKIPSKMY